MNDKNLTRRLLCPICGADLSVPADLPNSYELPEHEPGPRGNICAAYRVTVTIGRATCNKCGATIMKHPSGLCMKCYGQQT